MSEGIESYVMLDRWYNAEYVFVVRGDSVAITPSLDEDCGIIVMPRE